MLDIYPENEPAERAENRAFAAGDLSFCGKPLFAFSHSRQSAAVNLGLRFKTCRMQPGDVREVANPEHAARVEAERELAVLQARKKKPAERIAALAEFIASRQDAPESYFTYPGMDEDAAVVTYVMSLPDSAVHRVRRQSVMDAERDFDHWRDANQLGLGGRNREAALAVFVTVAAALNATESEPVIKDGESGGGSPNV